MALTIQHLAEEVRCAGFELVDGGGDRLGLRSTRAQAPPSALALRVKQAKREILHFLRDAPGADQWDGRDYAAFYIERIALRAEADERLNAHEARAFDDVIQHWLIQNPPPPSPPGVCAACRERGTPPSLKPFLAGVGHGWLHDHCYAPWRAARREAAVNALAVLGLDGAEASAHRVYDMAKERT